MRRSLYKYYDRREWAEALLDGKLLFHSLAFFRDYEDKNGRGDRNEGTSIFRPDGGLIINNETQGKTIKLPDHAFTSAANPEEIFVFSTSRSPSDRLREDLKAVACVEIMKVGSFCGRIKAALPPNATFRGRRVVYYHESESCNPRWALPEEIAVSKLDSFAWQDEYRFIFCLTDAFGFEKVALRFVHDKASSTPNPTEHHAYVVEARSLRDICRLHEFTED